MLPAGSIVPHSVAMLMCCSPSSGKRHVEMWLHLQTLRAALSGVHIISLSLFWARIQEVWVSPAVHPAVLLLSGGQWSMCWGPHRCGTQHTEHWGRGWTWELPVLRDPPPLSLGYLGSSHQVVLCSCSKFTHALILGLLPSRPHPSGIQDLCRENC